MATSQIRRVMEYAVPIILGNLASIDFLNNNVQSVGGKTPFYDDESARVQAFPKKGRMPGGRIRPSIHLKDSWYMTYTVRASEGKAIIRLYNRKKTADGKWVVADLLWYGTRDYNISAPELKVTVPVMYRSVAESAGSRKGWKGLASSFRASGKSFNREGQPVTQTLLPGHNTGRMSFYNRYAGKWFYNQKFRKGIRNELVTSFRQYILLCIENGIRQAVTEMEAKNLLTVRVNDVHVRVA